MPTYNIAFYAIDPVGLFSTSTGGFSTYNGPAQALGSAVITDTQSGQGGLTLSDDNNGNESATGDVTVNGNTSIGSNIDAELAWTIRDTVTGEVFQVVELDIENGDAAGDYLLSEVPLVVGRSYETLAYDTNPDSGDPTFNYVDHQQNFGIFGTQNNDSNIAGTTGDDIIYGGATESLSGTANDTINANAGNDVVYAGDGDDSVAAGGGSDTVFAGSGADEVDGGAGADTIFGEAGNDTIDGGDGADLIKGGAGADEITDTGGASSDDTIDGGAGDDTIDGGDGDDLIYGGDNPTPVTTSEVLDWTDEGGDNTDLSGGFTQNTGTMDVTVSFTNDGNNAPDFEVATAETVYTEGGEPFDPNSNLYLFGNGDGPTSTTTIDFASADPGVTDEVQNVQFRLADVDWGAGNHTDIVTINAFDAAGNPVTVDITPGGGDTVVGNTLTAEEVAEDAPDAGGSALVEIAGPVSEIEIIYVNGQGVTQAIFVSDVHFETISSFEEGADDSLSGGAGDDTIYGEAGQDTIDGGSGADTIFGDSPEQINYAVSSASLGATSPQARLDDDAALEVSFDNPALIRLNMSSLENDEENIVTIDGVQVDLQTLIDNGQATLSGGVAVGPNGGITGSSGSSTAGVVTFNVPVSSISLDHSGGGYDDLDLQYQTDTGYTSITDYSNGATGTFTADTATGGDDLIDGGVGADLIDAGEGSDTITLSDGFGNDTIDGSEDAGDTDIDVLDLSGLTEGVDVTYAVDPEDGTLVGGTSGDTVLFSNIEDITYTEQADTVDGSASGSALNIFTAGGDDRITGSDFSDTIDSGDGNDTVGGGSGSDSIVTGSGDDQVFAESGNDTVFLGDGNDTFYASLGNDLVYGEDGDDLLQGGGLSGNGNDTLDGGSGNDTLDGINGDDSLIGGTGDDSLDGGNGDDDLSGGADNDTLIGGTGDDLLAGDAGDDVFVVSEGDTAQGGDGDDFFSLIDYGEAGASVITIIGGEGDETDGDTLQLTPDVGYDDITFTNTDPGAGGGLSGSFTMADGTVVNFSEIENIICFTPGARILTETGERPIESLELGDMVVTRDHGLQPIRWIGKSTVPGRTRFAPVRLSAHILPGAQRDLIVSPQHRVLFTGYKTELMFGEPEVLVPAKHLIDGHAVRTEPSDQVTYIHLMFDRHEIIYADGAATESFHAGDLGIGAICDEAREELFGIFPELRSAVGDHGQTARLCLKKHEAALLIPQPAPARSEQQAERFLLAS